jgi:hypothetical protein
VTLTELLKGKSPQDFDAYDLMSKAHYRWSRTDPGSAALLFSSAHQRAVEQGEQDRVDPARNRAAICLWESGTDPQRALAELDAVVAFYQAHPERKTDAHFAEWAADALLEHAAAQGHFCQSYREMQARMAQAGRSRFPSIHPKQDRIAEWAMEGECPEVLRELLPRIKARKPLKRAVRARIKVWEGWLAACS